MLLRIENGEPAVSDRGSETAWQIELAASRQRCLEAYNLQPDSVKRIDLLTYQELRCKLDEQEDFVRVALPELEHLFQRLVDNEYMVSIVSPDGVMLLFRCDHVFLGDMSHFGVLPGSTWSEELQGTNGIGTCIKARRPLSVVGTQHFNMNVHTLSCTAAPVFGSGGEIESVVNVTSSRPVDDKMERIVRNIVTRSAARIENKHFASRARDMRIVRLARDKEFSDLAAEARLALDAHGRIVDVTSSTSSLIAMSREELIGQDVSTIMEMTSPLEETQVAKAHLLHRRESELFASLYHKPGFAVARRLIPVGSFPAVSREVPPGGDRLIMHPRLAEQIQFSERMFAARIPILIEGETGTGKTSFARSLARQIKDQGTESVIVNCAPLAGDGDALERIGDLCNATIVLDLIDEASMAAQAKLIQLLSDDELLRSRNIRIIATSSANLMDCVQTGQVRTDLYYRLKGSIIVLEPLRSLMRLEDILQFAIDLEAPSINGENAFRLDEGARLVLVNYHWPGNMRELRQAIKHAVVLAKGKVITIGDLPQQIVGEVAHRDLTARSQSEAARIEAALRHNSWNVSETARYLGVSRATLYRKIEISNIRTPIKCPISTSSVK